MRLLLMGRGDHILEIVVGVMTHVPLKILRSSWSEALRSQFPLQCNARAFIHKSLDKSKRLHGSTQRSQSAQLQYGASQRSLAH